MDNAIPRSLGNKPRFWPKELPVFALLFFFGLLLRFPFFFPAVLDWDESTFILMGQSILDGHLPYVELWDNKPPLAFAFFALAIAAVGKDLVGIRVAGTLCVVVTAFLTYLTASRLWNRRTGIVAATLCIMTISLLNGGQSTMTEHVALLPLAGALYLLVHRDFSVSTLFIVGTLMGIATLVRPNIAYLAILIGFYVLVVSAKRSQPDAVRNVAAYTVGGILVVVMTWLPYLLTGQQEVWWASVVSTPFTYASARSSLLKNLLTYTTRTLDIYRQGSGIRVPGQALFLLGAAGLVVTLWRWQSVSDKERRGSIVLILFTIGTAFSILKSGPGHQHYMIQLAPFSAMLAAVFLEQLLSSHLRLPFLLLLSILITVSMKPILAEYRVMLSHAIAHQELRYGAAYEIAAYLKRENTQGRPLYLLTDHIAYWLTDSYPPTKLTTHPSNIVQLETLKAVFGKEASTEGELRKVFRKQPEFVVTIDNLWYLDGNSAKIVLDGTLASEYAFVREIQGRKIFRKNQAH